MSIADIIGCVIDPFASIISCVQLNRCVEEFESLVSLSMSLLEGQEPTAAMLFGSESECSCVQLTPLLCN